MKTKFSFAALVFVVCANISITASAQVKVQDSLALVALYNSTNGPGWDNHTNWLTSSPIPTWFGISVDDRRVTDIRLPHNMLQEAFRRNWAIFQISTIWIYIITS